MVYFFILPACPLSDVFNKLPTVAGLLDSSGIMRCNDVSINFKGSNVPSGQVIPLMYSRDQIFKYIKANLKLHWRLKIA